MTSGGGPPDSQSRPAVPTRLRATRRPAGKAGRATTGTPPWAKWWQLACPARAVRGPSDYPGCDLRRGHDGPHIAERGMFDEIWSEQWQ